MTARIAMIHGMREDCMRTLLAVLVTMLLPAAASAETVIAGLGTQTCRWVSNAASLDPSAYHHALTWVQGYMSALNDVLASTGRHRTVDLNPHGFSTDEQVRAIERYCDAFPEDSVYDAGMGIYTTLRREHDPQAQ